MAPTTILRMLARKRSLTHNCGTQRVASPLLSHMWTRLLPCQGSFVSPPRTGLARDAALVAGRRHVHRDHLELGIDEAKRSFHRRRL